MVFQCGDGGVSLWTAPTAVLGEGRQANKVKLLPPVAAAAYSLSTAAITRS